MTHFPGFIRRALQHAAAWRIRQHISDKPRRDARRAVDALPDFIARYGWCSARRGGLRWHLNLSDNLQRALFFRDAYTARQIPHILDIVRPDDVVLDIGANIGTFCLPLAQRIHVEQIHAFEPGSDIYQQLCRHIRMNRLEQSVTAHHLAFGDERGELALRHSVKYGTAGASARTLYGEGDVVEHVPVETVDHWLSEHPLNRIDIVKLDVEGAEHHVLSGATTLLSQYRPRALIVELIDELLAQAGVRRQDVTELLAKHGYRPWNYRAGRFVPAELSDMDRNPVFAPDGITPVQDASAATG